MLQRFGRRIVELTQRDDLAAVFIHLNDTYLIEGRPQGLPGLARVASFVKRVRQWVIERVGEDRTLVLHSGDFLSPSLMSNSPALAFKGKQMIDLLNHCEVDFVTLGNHEFDFGAEVLAERLSEARFKVVTTNLRPPAGFPICPQLAFWPETDPFVAILGLAGNQTIGKGKECGFTPLAWPDALGEALETARRDARIGALAVLTHMDRGEDKDLQKALNRNALWPKFGSAYLLGGHDHDIDWPELRGRTMLSKNKSNCRTITVAVLAKSEIAAPRLDTLPDMEYPPHSLKERLLAESDDLPSLRASLNKLVAKWRSIVPHGVRHDFATAFERHLRAYGAGSYGRTYLRETARFEPDFRDAIELAANDAYGSFVQKPLLLTDRDLRRFPPDAEALAAVRRWEAKRDERLGHGGGDLIASFARMDGPPRFDATEASIRTRSTNFGNFVADAVKSATGADIALINAGCIRNDDVLGAEIYGRDLRDAFLFDGPNAVGIIEMSAEEVISLCEFGMTKGGQGAFLQISESLDAMRRRSGVVRVAIVSFLLKREEDGYLSLLAGLRGVAPGEIESQLCYPDGEPSMTELVSRGAPSIAYSAEVRLACVEEASDPADDPNPKLTNGAAQVIAAVDGLIAVLGRHMDRSRHHALVKAYYFENLDLPDEVKTALEHFYERMRQLMIDLGIQWMGEVLGPHLSECRVRYEKDIPYHFYMEDGMEVVAAAAHRAAARAQHGE